jgi:hypothetical protein
MLNKIPHRGRRRRAGALDRAVGFSIEPLEDRVLFSTLMVSSLADSGAGSLRAAINSANAAGGSNTIVVVLYPAPRRSKPERVVFASRLEYALNSFRRI